ncbi:nucleotide-binding protein [Candidatus Magnetoovum chiemensis]|nr:nucleotide-binding protein [Candidatus Magnetoovum chiemensis]
MSTEHTFDIVCEVDLQEVANAIHQALKEITQRYDFKSSKSSIDFDKTEALITLISEDEYRMNALKDILETKLVKRNISLKALSYSKLEQASGNTVRLKVSLQQGIPIEKAKEMVKLIKNTKLKVTSEIRKDEVRVKGKKLDELQEIISMLKSNDFGIDLQFRNYR